MLMERQEEKMKGRCEDLSVLEVVLVRQDVFLNEVISKKCTSEQTI